MVEHPCVFRSPDEVVYLVDGSGETEYLNAVEFDEGLGYLSLCAEGFVDEDSNFVLSVYITVSHSNTEAKLRCYPDKVQALANGKQMKVVKTGNGKDRSDTGYSYHSAIVLRSPLSGLHEVAADTGGNQQIEITIDLSSYVSINDAGVDIESIRGVQKMPIPVRR